MRWLTWANDVEVGNHEDDDVPSRNSVWWRESWLIRIEDGPLLQTARERRKAWRAATRAVEEVRDGMSRVGREDLLKMRPLLATVRWRFSA